MCGCLSHAPYGGPGLQPRHVPGLGIVAGTLYLAGWHSIHGATPARMGSYFFFKDLSVGVFKVIQLSLSLH